MLTTHFGSARDSFAIHCRHTCDSFRLKCLYQEHSIEVIIAIFSTETIQTEQNNIVFSNQHHETVTI